MSPVKLANSSTTGSRCSAPPALSLLEPLHAARGPPSCEHRRGRPLDNRLVCIVVHLHLMVPSTLRPPCSVHIGALPRLLAASMGTALVLRKGRHGRRFSALCDDWHMALRLVLWPAGLALGAFSLAIARDEPAFSFAGSSLEGAVALLGAGWALLACGLVFGPAPGDAVGPLLVAAGYAWFLAEWDNPGVGSAVVFTIGLVTYAVVPRPGRLGDARLPGRPAGFPGERVAVALALPARARARSPAGALLRPGGRGCLRARTTSCSSYDEPGPSTTSTGSASSSASPGRSS